MTGESPSRVEPARTPRSGGGGVLRLFALLFALWNLPALVAHTRLGVPLGLERLTSPRAHATWAVVDLLLAMVLIASLLIAHYRPSRERLRLGLKLALAGALPLAFLGGELLVRASRRYATWSELTGGGYVSGWNQRFPTPWVLLTGESARLHTSEFDHEVRTNAEGLRDVEHPLEKPPGEYRIVGLGDSFTMGQGAEFEDGYLRVLQRDLNARATNGTFRVVCGGVAGSDPVFEYQLLARRLLKYRPDLVIMAVNLSDLGDITLRGGMDRFDDEGRVRARPAPRLEWLFGLSHLARAALIKLLDYDMYVLGPRERAAGAALALDTIVEAAVALRDLGRREGFQVLVVYHPMHYQVQDPNAADELAPLAGRLEAEGVACLDLLPWFRQHVPPERVFDYFWPLDRHCNARGYRVLAEGIEARLETLPGFPRPGGGR